MKGAPNRRRQSIFSGDGDLQAIERAGELQLARQARAFVAVRRAVEQVVLVLAHRRQFVRKFRIDMDMASGARTAATTKGEQFIKAIVANHFHHGDRKSVVKGTE